MAQILVGNKSDMAEERRAVSYSSGKALADEYGIPFLETSAKDNVNVEQVGRGGCGERVGVLWKGRGVLEARGLELTGEEGSWTCCVLLGNELLGCMHAACRSSRRLRLM